MDSNEFYIHSVWASMGAWRDINILDNADAGTLDRENGNWEWLGNLRTKPFGMHLRAQKQHIHKDRCPRHEDPRLHPELPESPYEAFFPIPGPTQWRPPRDPKFERLPIASYSTGFDFGKNTSLLNASGCFNLPNQNQAAGAQGRPATGNNKFGVPFRSHPEKTLVRCKSETVYSKLVPTDIRGTSIEHALKRPSRDDNELPSQRNSHNSIHSSLRGGNRSNNNSKRPSQNSLAH